MAARKKKSRPSPKIQRFNLEQFKKKHEGSKGTIKGSGGLLNDLVDRTTPAQKKKMLKEAKKKPRRPKPRPALSKPPTAEEALILMKGKKRKKSRR